MKFQVFSANEWLYPDCPVDEAGMKEIRLAAARGGYAACQILCNDAEPHAPISCVFRPNGQGALTEPECYQLIDVFVEKNTGPYSFCVQEGESAEGYATRLAPFRVYEALKPLAGDTVSRAATEALYICWPIPDEQAPGEASGELEIRIGGQTCRIPVSIDVFAARIPRQGTLAVTNWFSLGKMATRYGLEPWSEAHWAMIRKYGRLMRRARQTHFWVPMEAIGVETIGENAYDFDFSRAERLIRTYLALGFTHIEGGLVSVRRHFKDAEFVIPAPDRTLPALSGEGYAYLAQFYTAWRAFLEKNGWLGITIQHVADEPTEWSAREYRLLAGIVRKFMPGVPLVEAVEVDDIDGSVDIWVPKNNYYEERREQFERKRLNGDTLWFYTCCIPGGRYMNRLWDMPLLRTRYLHWGNYKYGLEGFLHWGLNFCDDDQDPFEQRELFFPPGDTHITFPGPDGPLGSMRFEAMRAGIEDYELLRYVAESDKAAADAIAASCMTSFSEADENPGHFEAAHRALLAAASAVPQTLNTN